MRGNSRIPYPNLKLIAGGAAWDGPANRCPTRRAELIARSALFTSAARAGRARPNRADYIAACEAYAAEQKRGAA